MIIIINISSKSYVSLNNFINFFLSKKFMSKLKVVVQKSKFVHPTKSNLYTVLKSPHVNKTAQEQFISKTFNIEFELFVYQPHLFFFFLKIIKNTLISDIIVNYKIIINKTLFKNKIKNTLTPNGFNFILFDKKKKKIVKFYLKQYLKLTAIYGEFLLTNKKISFKCLGSSVG